MKNQIKKIFSAFVAIGVVFSLFSCTGNGTKDSQSKSTGVSSENILAESTASFKLSCNEEDEKTILLKDLIELPVITKSIHTENAIGEKSTFTVQGFTLSELCKAYKVDISSFQTLSVTASDGYVATLKQDVLTKNEVILAYQKDGSPLKEDEKPLTLVIDNMPSSTFVNSITSLHFANDKQSVKPTDKDASSIILSDFSVLVNGLSDGEMNLSSQKLARNLKSTTVTATVKEDGKMVENNFYGYTLKGILAFVHVDTFSNLKITAEDGFEASITNDELDESVILTANKGDGKDGTVAIALRIVGKNLSGKQQVSKIASISIIA